jgi:hypothetical protein
MWRSRGRWSRAEVLSLACASGWCSFSVAFAAQGIGAADAVGGKLVNMGCLVKAVAVAAEVAVSDVVEPEEENAWVGWFGGVGEGNEEEGCEKGYERFHWEVA